MPVIMTRGKRYRDLVVAAVPGANMYLTAGTFNWTVPANVTSICAVCVGAGGGGHGQSAQGARGGAGGGLAYVNDIAVTPGEVLTVVVGSGGIGSVNNGVATAGGETSIWRGGVGGTRLVGASGGGPGMTQTVTYASGNSNPGGPIVGIGGFGGTGARGTSITGYNTGGGGAGGYNPNTTAGDGGNDNDVAVSPTQTATTTTNWARWGQKPGSGGGGGGGTSYTSNTGSSEGGGGVGLYGYLMSSQYGAQTYALNGAGDYGRRPGFGFGLGGGGGSAWQNPTASNNKSTKNWTTDYGTTHADYGAAPTSSGGVGGNGAFPGGGGGSAQSAANKAGNGAQGGVRIMWGAGRSFPSNAWFTTTTLTS